jgi:nucleoside-diphosphate-sugar epimerase
MKILITGNLRPPMGNACEEVTFEVNYRAGIELARQAKAAGVRSFVFASSCSVSGHPEIGSGQLTQSFLSRTIVNVYRSLQDLSSFNAECVSNGALVSSLDFA